ncbi:hypothetical protein WICPIJ_005034 [Wickerhamomyces pijperi]|uniref:Dolichyl-diphosphooligosaccharide--protein glycosyltransferase subunit 3 n=1 Tax=Wickerhamomyces pijperi TaxID=599730 RepID=A0A9P8Q4P7_WICPI|nr:hypothetical protein WICPIJ_005034 [Wickerhamomyces pijperi]
MQISSSIFLTFLLAVVTALDSAKLLQLKNKGSNGIIKLTNSNFQKVVTGPRDSHLLVMLTATNANVGCITCVEMQPLYHKIAESWFESYQDGKKVFFAEADFVDGQRDVFQAYQVNNVPKIYYYPPTEESLPITSGSVEVPIAQDSKEFVKSIHNLIESVSGEQFRIIEPIQWGNIIISILTIALLTFVAVKFHSFYVPLLTSPGLWGAVVVFFIIIFNAGYMFNSIRNTPYVRPGSEGQVEYFMPGQQQQLGAETQIVSFIYAILSFTVISLITKVKAITHQKVQIVVISLLCALIFVVFSAYLNIFAFKSQGYPYTLLDIVKF